MEDHKGGAAMLRLLRAVEGTLRYRVVTEGVEGSSFKHRIAKIHATSMKRLSKIELGRTQSWAEAKNRSMLSSSKKTPVC